MAADCEIGNCGVLAVGRCANPDCEVPGGAAYCASHVDWNRGWCALCIWAEDQQRQETERSTEEAREEVRRIARSLVAEGYPPDERYFRAVTYRNTLFGRPKAVEDPARDRYGWYVGTYEWSAEKHLSDGRDTPGRVIRTLRTFVTEHGDLAAEGGEEGYPRIQGRYMGLSEVASVLGQSTNPPTEAELWKQITDALAKLAQRRGVSITPN